MSCMESDDEGDPKSSTTKYSMNQTNLGHWLDGKFIKVIKCKIAWDSDGKGSDSTRLVYPSKCTKKRIEIVNLSRDIPNDLSH
jgi:hypothetical protein